MTTPSRNDVCPHCGEVIGGHTIDGWAACLEAAGMSYTLPYEEVPGGPLRGPSDQIMVGDIVVKAGTMETSAFGTIPVVVFTFYSPGLAPMSRVPTPEYALVGDVAMFREVKRLIDQAIDGAIGAST